MVGCAHPKREFVSLAKLGEHAGPASRSLGPVSPAPPPPSPGPLSGGKGIRTRSGRLSTAPRHLRPSDALPPANFGGGFRIRPGGASIARTARSARVGRDRSLWAILGPSRFLCPREPLTLPVGGPGMGGGVSQPCCPPSACSSLSSPVFLSRILTLPVTWLAWCVLPRLKLSFLVSFFANWLVLSARLSTHCTSLTPSTFSPALASPASFPLPAPSRPLLLSSCRVGPVPAGLGLGPAGPFAGQPPHGAPEALPAPGLRGLLHLPIVRPDCGRRVRSSPSLF